MRKDIAEYNKISGESLYAEINSYLEIVYVDLLGDKQSIYYSTNLFNTIVIENENGKVKFDKYDEFFKCDLGINPNREDNIAAEELIDNIYKISELNYEENIEDRLILGNCETH